MSSLVTMRRRGTDKNVLQMKRQEGRDALAICGVGGAEPRGQFPFLEPDHDESEYPPDRQDNPQSRSSGEQPCSCDRAKHSRVARMPHMAIEPAGEHLAFPGKFRVPHQSAAAQFS